MKFKSSHYLILILFFCQQLVLANNEDSTRIENFFSENIKANYIGFEQGLSQGMINDLTVDQDGYVWIATKEGLNRFDGKKMKVFKHDYKNPKSISSNHLLKVFVDSKNRLWIGSDINGLNLFDRENESFIKFNAQQKAPYKLSSNAIGVIKEDKDGNIWVQTKSGFGYDIIMLEDDNSKQLLPSFSIVSIQDYVSFFKSDLDTKCCTHNLYFTAQNDIWYYDGQLYKISVNTPNEFSSYRHVFESDKVGIDNKVLFDETKDEIYYVSNQFLLKYDSNVDEFLPYLKLPDTLSFNFPLFIDNHSQLWMTSKKNLLYSIDLESKNLTLHTINKLFSNDEAYKTLFFLHHDNTENLWIGSGGFGLLQLSRFSKKFKEASPLKDSQIWHYQTHLPGKTAIYSIHAFKKWHEIINSSFFKEKGLSYTDYRTSLTLDENGSFVFCMKSEQEPYIYLLKLDASTLKLSYLDTTKITNKNYWPYTPIFIDYQNDIWYGEKTLDKKTNLYVYRTKTSEKDIFSIPTTTEESASRFINDWKINDKNQFWFGTVNGLFFFDSQNNSWKHYQTSNSNNSLSSNIILSIEFDPLEPYKYLWVGTDGAGLNRFDLISKEVKVFSTKDGLPNDVIYSIQSDENKHLWLSTNQGLCLFNPNDFTTRNFSTYEGLAGNEFNRYQYSKSSNGTLYFGGIDGINYFNPKSFYENPVESKTVISSFKINNTEINFGDTIFYKKKPFYLSKPIEQLEEIILNHYQRIFSFGFSVLDASSSKKSKIKYRLKGFQDDWIEADISYQATFTNLNPGNYTLQVLGKNSFDVWNVNPTNLAIKILPHWTGTWWFKVIIVLLILVALYLAYRIRISHVLKIEKLRNQIAQDLHDDIGSTLSSISIYSYAIQKSNQTLNEDSNKILNNIIESISQTMEKMNDIVWSIKPENDSFQDVIYRMHGFAVNITEAQDIFLKFEASDAVKALKLDMMVRKNLYLIFKECINNSIKHASCRLISVYFYIENKHLIMKIKDDGKGFKHKKEFNLGGSGLKNIQSRINEINGHIEVLSNSENGTQIIVSVKIKNSTTA